MKLQLELTLEQLEKLHESADTPAKQVRVDAQALRAILIDHSRMVATIKESRIVTLEEPYKQKERKERERLQ